MANDTKVKPLPFKFGKKTYGYLRNLSKVCVFFSY